MKKAKKFDKPRQARRQRAMDRYSVSSSPDKTDPAHIAYLERKAVEHASLTDSLSRRR